MSKANIVLPDGTRVTIEGTADDVAAVLQRVSGGGGQSTIAQTSTRAHAHGGKRRAPARKVSTVPGKTKARGPADYIRDLVNADYFKTKRGLSEVRLKLEEGAHIYAVTSLSPVLFRLVQARELRRIKEDGTWRYVNP